MLSVPIAQFGKLPTRAGFMLKFALGTESLSCPAYNYFMAGELGSDSSH